MLSVLRCIVSIAVANVAFALPAEYPTIPMRGVLGNVPMPMVGIGTWQYNSSLAESVVTEAFKLGYRHVDTAMIYENQVGVGAALKKSGLERSEYFVTSKIPGGLNATATKAALDSVLKDLDLEYVDLMLIHFPTAFPSEALSQGTGAPSGPALRKEEWLAMEAWAKSGRARAIGVSHYCQSHVEDILSVATVPIALNQVMYHVGMGKSPDAATDDKGFMQSKDIVYMSFSTLCGPCGPKESKELIDGPLVTEIGKNHGVSGAQVALRWAVQQGIPVVPKSRDSSHLKQNLDLFSFSLSDSEMARLNAATTPATGADASGDCGIEATASLVV
eukprot:TRINITY_DN31031_c0_g1_i1.p1 TRINITY_DN31031_c0_g1~~TRINITY_DN31031_c0_g1_i1.p1  ORF type:complete len:332 (-),score=68.89 TRINITY_DN31031_c0_g1_i1:64-1059(-)